MNEINMQNQIDGLYDEDKDWSFPQCKYVYGYKENQAQLQPSDDFSDCLSNWQINQYLDAYFRFFGQKDMDIIYLYFISKKKQEEIAIILNKTQPAVSYDVNRIKQQMDFVIKLLSSVDDFIMFITDQSNNLKTYDKEMLTVFFYSTSITKTALILGINTVSCRSHLNTIVNKLFAQGYNEMYHLFKFILSNLNKTKKICSN